mgnify:CR=1 FL=1|tara:strand:- start:2910 stop:3284 length:375 start_codon:yes stop_codon:yes gene_type:complete
MKHTGNPLRVIIADRNQIYQEALLSFARKQDNVELIRICKTEEELILTLKTLGITCLIIDEGFFGFDPVEEIRSIKKHYPELIIVGLSIDGSKHMEREMMLAGAYKYLSKWNLEEDLQVLFDQN